jgi:hypothetical protein
MAQKLVRGIMRVEHLVEFLCAAHVAQQVESPWQDRGGIGLVAEPESLKTTLAGALGVYPNVRMLSDVNVTELANLRGDMVSNTYKTIVFLDYQKIFERHQDSAANIQGVLRALTGEGWQGLAHEAQVTGMPARCFVVLCITPGMWKRKGLTWKENGFRRRFLWLQYAINNPEVIRAAQKRWEKVSTGSIDIPYPVTKIPMRLTPGEMEVCEQAVINQTGITKSIPFQIMARSYQILKWHYKNRRGNERKTPDQIIQGIASLASEHGGELVLTAGPELVRSKKLESQTA